MKFTTTRLSKFSALKLGLGLTLAFGWTSHAHAHVTLETAKANTGSTYKAIFRVGHGCEGAATTAIEVLLPAGFKQPKPMPKANWTLSTDKSTLLVPYTYYGKTITEEVTRVVWTAQSKEHFLADAHFDEFVLRGTLPETAGPLWFKVNQTCEKGSTAWTQIPEEGTDAHSLSTPAALLEVISDPHAAHQHG